MRQLNGSELQKINGGEITLDVNELIDQINPMQWCYDFGHDVVYVYVWEPITNLFN